MSAASLGASAAAPATPTLLEQLRVNPRLPLMIGASAAVAAIAALWMWSSTPDYGVLYSNLSDRDGGEIIASLQQMNIPYKFAAGGGALLVAANKVPEARLRLASQGLPKGGSVGFELMDNQKFGTSQFAEQVNYQRALEGELARSINSISAVESARVHLALPKPSLFVRDQKNPSASVILNLHRGRSLDEGQISAMVHLISSSVPALSPKSITVVDQVGNLLSAANAGTRGLDVSQLKYAQEIEQSYIRRIEAILQPIVGANNVHAQVVADIDFSIVENTDETYRPNQDPGSAAVRSQQSSESDQQGAGAVGGVPGALTNQPAPDPIAPITTPAEAAAAGAPGDQLGAPTEMGNVAGAVARDPGPASNRKDTTINYELDRSIRHVQQGAGGIKRLSVAVVVNYRTTMNNQGLRTTQALSPAELTQIQNLVRESMGFNAARGDSLNVLNSEFAIELADSSPELPWWRQAANIELAKQLGQYLLLAVLGLYLWLAVARPLLRKHINPVLAAAPAPAPVADKDSAADSPSPAMAQEHQAQRHLDNIKYAQDTAAKEPRMVAMLVKHWIKKNA